MKKSTVSIVGLSLILSGTTTSLLACDLCSVYSAAHARGETGKGFFGGVAEQFTHFGTTQIDGMEVPNVAGQHLDSSISQLFAGYNFNDRFSLQLNVPIIYRSFKRPDDLGGIEHGTESGLGDLSLLASIRPYFHETIKSTFSWNVVGGVKFPTGSSRRLHEEVDELTAPEPPPGAPASGIHGHDITLGSGSIDGIIGTGIYARWKRCFLTASTQYTIRSQGDFNYQFANDLTWAGGPGYMLVLNDYYTIAIQAVVSGETKGKDTFLGMKAEDTGMTAVYLGPQINFTWSDKLSAEIGVDLPVSIANTSFQTVPDYRVRAGLTWHF
ncbi:MAG: hypothetical protein JWQ71_2444 [Pedosphaera sp.]|nr:hypothetical protein [Pedosphaera sp.]